MKFRFISDLTSDVVFEAYGKTLKEVFENSALALFNVICDAKSVKPALKKKVVVSGDDASDLLFNWLQELIGIVDSEGMFLSKFSVKKITEKSMEAEVFGEEATPEKGGTVVKAVTYYKFNLEKTPKGYKATVALDI